MYVAIYIYIYHILYIVYVHVFKTYISLNFLFSLSLEENQHRIVLNYLCIYTCLLSEKTNGEKMLDPLNKVQAGNSQLNLIIDSYKI